MLPTTAPQAARFNDFVIDSHYMSSVEIETHGAVPNLEQQVRQRFQELNPNLTITSFALRNS